MWLENGGLATEVAAALSSSGGDQVVEEVAAALVQGSTWCGTATCISNGRLCSI